MDRLTGFARQYSKSCNCKVKGRKELQKWHLRAYLKSFRTYLKNLRGKGRLTEADVKAALKEVKIALLEADVNFKV